MKVPRIKSPEPAMIEYLRPNLSAKNPPSTAPRIAPIKTELVAIDSSVVERLQSSCMYSMAPDMMPVSKPKRIPPTAEMAVAMISIAVIFCLLTIKTVAPKMVA